MNPQEIEHKTQAYLGLMSKAKALKTELAAVGVVQTDRPFAPLYTAATRKLNERGDRAALSVLIELANHADELGFCYPGFKRLATLCSFAPTTVMKAIERLMALDYIRVLMYVHPMEKTRKPYYRISPHVLHIREEIRSEAFNAYMQFPKQDRLQCNEIIHAQPYTEPSSEPKTRTRNSNQNQQPSSSSFLKNGMTNDRDEIAAIDPFGNNDDTEKPIASDNGNGKTAAQQNSDERRNNEVNPTRSVGTTTPPVPPPPPHPPLPPEFDPTQPLSIEHEARAVELVKIFETAAGRPMLQLTYARQYVTRYGGNKALAAARVACSQMPQVRNPVGKMDSDLRRSLVTEQDDPGDDPAPVDSYASGVGADWFDN